MTEKIIFEGVSQNNLKDITFSISQNKCTVVTGPSGSGKSSLAFETVYKEGQRRFWESLSSYTKRFIGSFQRPDYETARNIPPTIALEQKNKIRSSRATVATQTELYDLLMQLFAKDSKLTCSCGGDVEEITINKLMEILSKNFHNDTLLIFFRKNNCISFQEYKKEGFIRFFDGKKIFKEGQEDNNKEKIFIVADRVKICDTNRVRLREALELATRDENKEIYFFKEKIFSYKLKYACVKCSRSYQSPSQDIFSFNSQRGACPECKGFGNLIKYDMNLIIPNSLKSIRGGAIDPFEKPSYLKWKKRIIDFCKKEGVDVDKKVKYLSKKSLEKIKSKIYEIFKKIERKSYKVQIRVFTSRYKGEFVCPSCKGARVADDSLQYKFNGRSIYDIVKMTSGEAEKFFLQIDPSNLKAGEVIERIQMLLRYLNLLGLSYMQLDRNLKTLSGGELQRARLAGYLSSGLTNTLYVLDEPTTGLHSRDTDKLIKLMLDLCKQGNTLLVVEQDLELVGAANEVLAMGPESGSMGGELVFQGKPGDYLKEIACKEKKLYKRSSNKNLFHIDEEVQIENINFRNFKNCSFKIPIGQLVCVTGVSGSGKTTLLKEILFPAVKYALEGGMPTFSPFKSIKGHKSFNEVVLVDQNIPVKSSRSTVVTYLNVYDEIRKLLCKTEQAKKMKLKPGAFSFNIDGGRCDECKGEGSLVIDMSFMGEIEVECHACNGRRFKNKILGVRYGGRNIYDILNMTVDQAAEFFSEIPTIIRRLGKIQELGLGYLVLGISLDKLSGGELQRVKILKHLQEKKSSVLYLFDEPSIGLGFFEIPTLVNLFYRLVENGHTVVCVEHNLEIIYHADTIIDLGPEGGEKGGKLVYKGNAGGILHETSSHTGRYLKKYLGFRKKFFNRV